MEPWLTMAISGEAISLAVRRENLQRVMEIGKKTNIYRIHNDLETYAG